MRAIKQRCRAMKLPDRNQSFLQQPGLIKELLGQDLQLNIAWHPGSLGRDRFNKSNAKLEVRWLILINMETIMECQNWIMRNLQMLEDRDHRLHKIECVEVKALAGSSKTILSME